jgi:DNA gyrase subunit A
LRDILSDHQKVVDLVDSELEEIKNRYGDKRLTEISGEEANIDDEDLIPEEDIIITTTSGGYIKRQSVDDFKVQRRGGKGVRGMATHDDDEVEQILFTKTHTDLLFFTNLGKVYRIRGYRIPASGRASKGTPYVNLFESFEKEEKVMSIVAVDNEAEGLDEKFLLFATTKGLVKRTALSEFRLIRQSGKIAITLKDGDSLLGVKLTSGHALICISGSNGKMVKFPEEDVRPMGRTATGVKGINVGDEFEAVGLSTSDEGDLIFVLSEHGYGKLSKLEDYRLTSRGTKGVTTLNMTEKTGKIVTTKSVHGDEDIMIITAAGIIIRTSLTEVKVVGRNTQGVKIIRIKDNEQVSSITVLGKHEDEELTETEEANEVVEDVVADESSPVAPDEELTSSPKEDEE